MKTIGRGAAQCAGRKIPDNTMALSEQFAAPGDAAYRDLSQPDRAKENSPPIYRWVASGKGARVPSGTKEMRISPTSREAFFRPWRDLLQLQTPIPTVETVGYSLSPCRALEIRARRNGDGRAPGRPHPALEVRPVGILSGVFYSMRVSEQICSLRAFFWLTRHSFEVFKTRHILIG